MDYNTLLSIIFFLCGSFYMFFGIYTIVGNSKSRTNWQFLFLMASMSIWAFAYSFANSAPTAEKSAFWTSIGVFGWGMFYAFFLRFTIILADKERRFNNRLLTFAFYVPALITIIIFGPLGFLAGVRYEFMPTDSGFFNFILTNLGQLWVALYPSIYTVISLVLLIRWWKTIKKHSPLKIYVTYFIISIIIPFMVGIFIGIFPRFFGLEEMPRITVIFLVPPAILLFITLRKFGMLLERKTKRDFSPLNPKTTAEESRFRLFQTAAAIYGIGAAASFLSGYFLADGKFINEFMLSLTVWVFAIFLLLVPYMTKNKLIQNILFFLTSVVGMTFFIIKDVNLGASTVWAIYIVFLLYSIVLDSKRHTLFFLVFTLIAQFILWIIFPNVSVVIDNSQYMKRIFIITLSYFAVRYVTNEYGSKFRGYQRFSREQEILEKISSNFISVDRDNVRLKIDEMFNLAAEILNYDQAYLFRLDESGQNATILNAYVKDSNDKSLRLQLGKRFSLADFPEIEPLAGKNSPIFCEDVTNLSIDNVNEENNFFTPRGIKSFYALPIIVEQIIRGFFVVEYKEKGDQRITTERLHLLTIIANILGDTRKKILYEERLFDFAYFDKSTKLPNRNMLRKNLEQLMLERKESDKLVIFNIELDNLRMINDTFGHATGEQVVVKSAHILAQLMRDDCILSRIADDKFIVVMPSSETIDEVVDCAQKITDAFSDPILPKDGIESLFVTTNIGVAIYPEDGNDADTLLQNADIAAYEAKISDHKIVFCSNQLKNHVEENTLLTIKLFKSLANEEFWLQFQPQISCETGTIIGVEALLRWTTDDGRRIAPDVFIPMLEQTGLIHDVGLWVLEQALLEHKKLVAAGYPPLRFSINLSIAQFRKDNFITDVLTLLTKNNVDPKYIELEVTESLLSKNFDDTISKLEQLNKAGLNIAIDDFGKGYSSLHRLQLVPFNRIKIDKSVVDDILTEPKKVIIAKTIIALAKSLNASITTEGVETKEQADFMKKLGSDEIQGYYYSRPLSPDDLEKFLNN